RCQHVRCGPLVPLDHEPSARHATCSAAIARLIAASRACCTRVSVGLQPRTLERPFLMLVTRAVEMTRSWLPRLPDVLNSIISTNEGISPIEDYHIGVRLQPSPSCEWPARQRHVPQ